MFICYVGLARFVLLLQNGRESLWRDINILFAKNLSQLFFLDITQTMFHQVMNNVRNDVSVALLSLDGVIRIFLLFSLIMENILFYHVLFLMGV
jgi:hypothetical protein